MLNLGNKEFFRLIVMTTDNWITKIWDRLKGNGPKWLAWSKLAIAFALAGGLAFAVLALLVYIGALGPLPSYAQIEEIQNNTATEIYGSDGALLGKYFKENRINANLEEIAPEVVNALVATEDARFFEHSGVDLRAWMRVFVKSILLSNESSGGGSTLSQQLAKNLFPRKDYWVLSMLINKMRETIIAKRLEKVYQKEELLNLYLNTVPFGENMYGIKVAGQRFFGKDPIHLQPQESALLVGMLKGNTLYNPNKNPERALQRRNVVLSQMVKYEYLAPSKADSLKNLPIELKYYREDNPHGLAAYFRETLRVDLEKILKEYKKADGSDYDLFTDGLKIYTTIDSRMQKHAEAAMAEHMEKLQVAFFSNWKKNKPWEKEPFVQKVMKQSRRYQEMKAKGYSEKQMEEAFSTVQKMQVFSWDKGDQWREMSPLDSIKYTAAILHAGLLAVETNTGNVKAWVGGIDHQFFQYDHVKSTRQIGSTFKPIVYAAALQMGMQPCQYTYNHLTTYPEYDNWEPRNADDQYGGVYSMEGALAKSVNAVTVDVLLKTGVEEVRKLAKAMGINSAIPKVPSIALGVADASLFDMTKVYATFANSGIRPEFRYLDRIETSRGEVIVSFKGNSKNWQRSISQDESAMMTHMLETTVNQGTGQRLRTEFGLNSAIAGKTGTTQNQSDGWFMGYTPKLVVGVWVGAESPSIHFRTLSQGQGSSTALPIWGRFMRRLERDGRFATYTTKHQFPGLIDSLYYQLQCPPYLEEMPLMAEDGEYYIDDMERFESILTEWYGDMEGRREFELKRRRPNETDEAYLERMQRYNERLEKKDERREERKDFWNNVLFGKDKKKDQ